MAPASLHDASSPGNVHPERVGDYTVLGKIGSGGMATVYRALHPATEREVALKVLAIQYWDRQDARTRFGREAVVLRQFDHPHILPVYDFGADGERLYLVMRLLDGRSLLHVLNNGPLTFELIGRYTREIASALDYAHARGVIHRDIKPANILLDADGRALLADFGVAQPAGGDARESGAESFVGTAAYASPEQCRGGALDRRSDIYSLAVLTFHMATGRLPFEASSGLAMIKMHLEERPPNPLGFNTALPIALYDVLLRGMAKDPNDRYPSAMKFSEAVDRALGVHELPEADSSDDWLVGDISPVTFAPDALPTASDAVISFADLPVTGTEGDPFAGAYGYEYDPSDLYFDDTVDLEALDDDSSFAMAFGTILLAVDTLDTNTAEPEPPDVLPAESAPVIRPIAPRAAPDSAPSLAPHAAPVRTQKPRDQGRALYGVVLASVVLLAVAVVGAMVAWRASHTPPDSGTLATYSEPALGITFDYPQDWTRQVGLAAVLSREATVTVALADVPVLVGGPYSAARIVITLQQIDPVAVFGVPAACHALLFDGPGATFSCMASKGYTTPVYSAYRTPRAEGVSLPGTLPPRAASLPMILLPTGDAPWIAVALAHWDGYPDARAALDTVAQSVR